MTRIGTVNEVVAFAIFVSQRSWVDAYVDIWKGGYIALTPVWVEGARVVLS